MKLSKELSEQERKAAIKELKKAMKQTKSVRMHQRYQIIILVLNGKKYDEIVEVTGRSKGTIVNYVKAYREGGVEGLKMKPYKGRSPKLTPEQEEHLYHAIVNAKPVDMGYSSSGNWTSALIRSWIKAEFGVEYSDRGTRDLLYRMKLNST